MSKSHIVSLNKAIELLIQGEIVAIPTETVYGLAANAENENAIRQVFRTKGRPLNHPLILHIADKNQVSNYALDIPDYAWELINQFWPGPLTLVFNAKKDKSLDLVRGGHDTIAIRCPKHPLTQELLSTLNFPLVAPSANPYEKISPTTAQHVCEAFSGANAVAVLDGGRCDMGIESTIIDVTHQNYYVILRHGMVALADICAVIPNAPYQENSDTAAPGKALKHYQPKTELIYFSSQQLLLDYVKQLTDSYYWLSFKDNKEHSIQPGFIFSNNRDDAFREFYYQLREADKHNVSKILIDLPPDSLQWQAIRERIFKAGRTSS